MKKVSLWYKIKLINMFNRLISLLKITWDSFFVEKKRQLGKVEKKSYTQRRDMPIGVIADTAGSGLITGSGHRPLTRLDFLISGHIGFHCTSEYRACYARSTVRPKTNAFLSSIITARVSSCSSDHHLRYEFIISSDIQYGRMSNYQRCPSVVD